MARGCSRCHQPGHYARGCPARPATSAADTDAMVQHLLDGPRALARPRVSSVELAPGYHVRIVPRLEVFCDVCGQIALLSSDDAPRAGEFLKAHAAQHVMATAAELRAS